MNEDCTQISCAQPNNAVQDYLNQYSLQAVIIQNTAITVIVNGLPYTIPAGTFTYSLSPVAVFSPLTFQGCSSIISVPIPPGSSFAQIQALVQGMLNQAAQQQAACNAAASGNLPAPQFLNTQVSITSICTSPQLYISGALPSGITQSGNDLICAAGIFSSNVSQAAADQEAKQFLQTFLDQLFITGKAICGKTLLVMKDDEVGNVLPTTMRRVRKLGSTTFIVGLNSTAVQIFTSTDYTSWSSTLVDTQASANSINDVAFGNGVYVAVTGNNNAVNSTNKGTSFVSADLSTWTKHTIGGAVDAFNRSFASVAFGNGVFVAVSLDGNRAVSADGITWVVSAGSGNIYNVVRFINNQFAACDSTGNVELSPDGTTWSSHDSGVRASDIAYGAGLYVVTQTFSGFSTSPDGITWTNSATPSLLGIAFGNGKFIAAGSTSIYSSPDGSNWTAQTTANHNTFGAEYLGNGQFMVIEFY
jgi:hypothetical protein